MNRFLTAIGFAVLSATFACAASTETTDEVASNLDSTEAKAIQQTALPSLVSHGAHAAPGAGVRPTQETAEVTIVVTKGESMTGAESSLDDMTKEARVGEVANSGLSPQKVQKIVGY
jgi:hypothetical protein